MALPEQVPGEEQSQFALLKTRRFASATSLQRIVAGLRGEWQ